LLAVGGKHGLIERLAPARPGAGKHQRVFLSVPALPAPFLDGVADGFRDGNQAVIAASIAVLAFDLLGLKQPPPSRVHDLK
jgi:hypothetical protein